MAPLRIVVALTLCTALASVAGGAGRAAAQETQYGPTGLIPPAPPAPADGTVAPAAHVEPVAAPPAATSTVPPVPPGPSDALTAPTPYGQGAPPGYALGAQLDAYDGSLHLPLDLTARMRALDRDLMALGSRGTTNIIDGVISLVAGAGMIALGVAFSDPGTRNLSTFLYVSGGGLLARAAVEFFVEPNPLEPAVHYAHMPMRNRAEVDLRLRYGEAALSGLASRYSISRILESTISISTAVGLCLAYYIPNGFNSSDAVSWIVAIFAGISVVTGLATLLTRSDAERRWDAYKEMRERMSSEDLQVAIAPVPGGAAVAAAGHF